MSAVAELQTQGGAPGGSAVPAPLMSVEDLLRTPIGFSEHILGLKLYDWQVRVLNWYLDPRKTTMGALCTPNGAGKSSGVVAALALWWVTVYPKGKVMITSKDGKQIDQQLYPALVRYRDRFKGWTWVTSPYIEITTASGGKIVAFTTNDPGRAEGWHPEPGGPFVGPVLIIVDEAKSVEPAIFDAIDRCTYAALLYVSSPGEMMGEFYDAFTKHKAIFKTKKVSLLDCPHIPREKIERMAQKHGVDSPLYRSSILGEFMLEGDVPYVFKMNEVQRAFLDPPRLRPGTRTFFCDFAAGGDENVLAMRDGNALSIVDAWREKDTVNACSRFVMNFRRIGATADAIFADNGGVGKAMVDNLYHLGWEINRVDNQSAPWDRNYVNRGAELWHELSGAIRRSEVRFDIQGDEQEEVKAQLCCRRSLWTNQGRLGVEPKEKMKERGIDSPDRADALCGAWTCAASVPAKERSIFDEYREEYGSEAELAYPPGTDPGS